ncbi:hypothetical protein [Wukongibacter sp. M2B1]|uniref:hypothetical protein n=1 Tax=Wukongibacter sp. M2B1 TaxID=3088895 RepID=UPI003D78EA3F
MFKIRAELLEKERIEASEIKSAEIMNQYIQNIYLCFINRLLKIHELLISIFKFIQKNRQKSHRKGKKTFFDILGVSYNHQEKMCKSAA